MCDDSFEEHVLPYPAEFTGLHLHGVNKNQGAFDTFDSRKVQAFAKEWGFIETPVITLQTPEEVRDFTDNVGKTGIWNGQAVEGFVVRTKVAHIDSLRVPKSRDSTSPPYPPGSDYFFKIKFDEPYMTYRDWREITRAILVARNKKIAPRVPSSKLRRQESFAYKDWVQKDIERDPASFSGFLDGKGIISVRERFLKWLGTDDGQKALKKQGAPRHAVTLGEHPPGAQVATDEKWERAVIVPVAGLWLIRDPT